MSSEQGVVYETSAFVPLPRPVLHRKIDIWIFFKIGREILEVRPAPTDEGLIKGLERDVATQGQ